MTRNNGAAIHDFSKPSIKQLPCTCDLMANIDHSFAGSSNNFHNNSDIKTFQLAGNITSKLPF